MPGREDGFTLAEVTVSLALAALLLAAAVPFFITAWQAAAHEQRRLEAQQSARFALDAVLREVRYASYFSINNAGVPDKNELVLHNQQGEIVHFSADGYRGGNPLADNGKYNVALQYQYTGTNKGAVVSITVQDKADPQASAVLKGTAVCLYALTGS